MTFEPLFQQGNIGRLAIRNRIVMPAIAANFGAKDGSVTDRLVDYYAARARGGVGLIVVEVTNVQQPLGRSVSRQIAIDDDSFSQASLVSRG